MKKRYKVLDEIRGIALINMIVYHAVWDMVYLFGADWKWFESYISYIWQQGICWGFIFLSGFCWLLGKKQFKRGLSVFLGGALISCVTMLFMPESAVRFGVLTLLGSCMMLMIPLHKILQKVHPAVGGVISVCLFLITKNVNWGYLGMEGWNLYKLPESWYRNLVTAYLGFPPENFSSADYFALFPWMFLFVAGYFCYRYLNQKKALACLERGRLPIMEWFGRHSFLIYMLHQPLVYIVLSIVFFVVRR